MASVKLVRETRMKVTVHNKAVHMKVNVVAKLKEYASSSKGNLITVRPSKIAQEINTVGRVTRADGVVIRNFLEQLVERGYMEVIKRSARGKVYGIRKGGEFWRLLMTHSPEDIVSLVNIEE
ncbi:MAG: DNA-binding protein [Caldivirga sp.]